MASFGDKCPGRGFAIGPGKSNENLGILFPALLEKLRRRYQNLDQQLLCDGLTQALIPKPTGFIPEKWDSFSAFVLWRARRNIGHLCRSQARRTCREKNSLSHVLATFTDAKKNVGNEGAPGDLNNREGQKGWLEGIMARLDTRERGTLRLWTKGIHGTRFIAKFLGFGHLPFSDQQHLVKRWTDRLIKKLRRWAKRDLSRAISVEGQILSPSFPS